MLTAPPIGSESRLETSAPVDFEQQAKTDLDRMICEAAYYISQQRGFEPGHELDDWLAAEAQIHDQLATQR